MSSLIKIRVGGNRNTVLSKKVLVFIEQQLKNPQPTITSYVELQQLIQYTFGETINYKTLYGYCNRVFKSKLKVSRKSHYKKDEQAIESLKKLPSLLLNIRDSLNNDEFDSVNIYCQDESRFGLITKQKRVLTLKVIKPIGKYKCSYQYIWL